MQDNTTVAEKSMISTGTFGIPRSVGATLKNNILKNINLCSDIHKRHKYNILQKLINQNVDLAAQGSPEWLAIREYSIGGSEMSIITGDNCFSKLDSLVAQKVGFSKFNGNIACRWGKIFEIITQRITERVLNIDQIYETGSLEGAVPHQRYSPDGLGVVKLHCESEFCGEMIETEEYCIVLFEYKSPYSSIPMGIIPKYYLPQVKTGLCSIPIADFAIFINNLYRKCAMVNLNESLEYDTIFHSRDTKFEPKHVLALGVNIFYQTAEQKSMFITKYGYILSNNEDIFDSDDYESESNDDDSRNIFAHINTSRSSTVKHYDAPILYQYIEKIIKGEDVHIRDFGKSYYGDFNNLLELYDQGLVSIKFCEPHVCEKYYENPFLDGQNKKPDQNNLDKLNVSIDMYKTEIKQTKDIIGYLPWKLFKSDIIYQERDPIYLKNYEPVINNTISMITDIQSSQSDFEKIKKFKKYFPKSKILKSNGYEESDAFQFLPRNI